MLIIIGFSVPFKRWVKNVMQFKGSDPFLYCYDEFSRIVSINSRLCISNERERIIDKWTVCPK